MLRPLSTRRTGIVFVEDFDVGVAVSIGGELINAAFSGGIKERYAIQIPGVVGPDEYGGMIPIIFDNPDDAYEKTFLPHVNLARTVAPAGSRRQSGGLAYRVAAPQAKMVKGWTGEIGPTIVEEKGEAEPYDLTYDIHIRTKRVREYMRVFRHIGGRLPPFGVVFVVDSEGAERPYDAFQESVADLSDVVDTQDREVGVTVTVRVEGELDFYDPVLKKTVYKARFTAEAM